MWEVDGGREFPKFPRYEKWLLEEQPFRFNWEVDGGREFPKFPLYGKWLVGEKPLCGRWLVGENSLRSHCMGSGY